MRRPASVLSQLSVGLRYSFSVVCLGVRFVLFWNVGWSADSVTAQWGEPGIVGSLIGGFLSFVPSVLLLTLRFVLFWLFAEHTKKKTTTTKFVKSG